MHCVKLCVSPFKHRSAIQRLEKRIGKRTRQLKGDFLKETSFGIGVKKRGKVRDVYELSDHLVVVTTDRLSAFDRYLTTIPFKGQALNQISAWWFQKTHDRIANGLLSVPDPNVMVMKKATVFPVEFVVRGYMTGSTSTSLWTHYKRGERVYCGIQFPDGLSKNDPLSCPVLTPTSKSDDHDAPLSAQEIINAGYMTTEEWECVSALAVDLFIMGQKEVASRDLILVDTKYEFGKDKDGNIILIDEVHTPDSSRYWIASSYEQCRSAGDEQKSIDKEFVRLWYADQCDPYNDKVLPEAPEDLVISLAARYVHLHEVITGTTFQYDNPDGAAVHDRIVRNVNGSTLCGQ